jgi:hypothetical protein
MSMFDMKNSQGSGWNYSDPDKPGFSTTLKGTVVEISNPQALDYNTREPRFWPDGNPVRNLRLTILTADGTEKNWVFAPKSKSWEACLCALDPNGDRVDRISLEELLGKSIVISTKDGAYNAKRPRPWQVDIMGNGQTHLVRGVVDLSVAPDLAEKARAQAEKISQPEEGPYSMEDIPF